MAVVAKVMTLVLLRRHGHQMVWIDARFPLADVMDLRPLGQVADVEEIGESVGTDAA